MDRKKVQSLTVWLLPVIVIGGLFYPWLGYLVVAMMAGLLTLSVFRGRFWCWNICPRGAFLDLVMPQFSRHKPVPRIFTRMRFRWLVFIALMGFLVARLLQTGGSAQAIGAVFVSMCLITTIIAAIIGHFTKPRGWCMICPMGTLQEQLGALSQGHKKVARSQGYKVTR